LCCREVLRDADWAGERAAVETAVQDRGAVHAGAHLHNHICGQHDRHLGAGYGQAAEPDISEDSDPKGTFPSRPKL